MADLVDGRQGVWVDGSAGGSQRESRKWKYLTLFYASTLFSTGLGSV